MIAPPPKLTSIAAGTMPAIRKTRRGRRCNNLLFYFLLLCQDAAATIYCSTFYFLLLCQDAATTITYSAAHLIRQAPPQHSTAHLIRQTPLQQSTVLH